MSEAEAARPDQRLMLMVDAKALASLLARLERLLSSITYNKTRAPERKAMREEILSFRRMCGAAIGRMIQQGLEGAEAEQAALDDGSDNLVDDASAEGPKGANEEGKTGGDENV